MGVIFLNGKWTEVGTSNTSQPLQQSQPIKTTPVQQSQQQPQAKPQQQMYSADLSSGVSTPLQQQAQQPAPAPAPQAQPSQVVKPNQVITPQQQEQPKPAQSQEQKPIDNKAITDVVSSVYSQYGMTPAQDKLAIHQQNIQKGLQQGVYTDSESARQDVNRAVVSGLGQDSGQVFNMMKSNIAIPNEVKSTNAFKDAQNRFSQLKEWTSMNATTFLASVDKIVPGSKLEQDLMELPGMKSQMELSRRINSMNAIAMGTQGVNKQHENEMNKSKEILDSIDQTIVDDFKQAMNSNEIQTKRKESDDAYTKLQDIDAQIANVELEVRQQYAGTGAGETQIRSIIAVRTANLRSQRGVDQARYDSAFARLSNATDLIKDEMEYRQNDRNFGVDAYAKLQTTPLAQTATAIRNEMHTKALNAQQALLSAPSIVGEISQEIVGGINKPEMWVGRAEELATKGYDKDQIKNQLMLEMQGARKSSNEEFQTYGQASKQMAMEYQQAQITNFADDNARLNNEMIYKEYTDVDGNKRFTSMKKYGGSPLSSSTAQDINGMGYDDIQTSRIMQAQNSQEGDYFGQCGAYMNNLNGTPGLYQDSLTSKKKLATKQYGEISDDIVIDMGTEEGHVGKIVDDLGDSWMIKSSNYNNNGLVSIDQIKKNDKRIVGYVPLDTLIQSTKMPRNMKDAYSILAGISEITGVQESRRTAVQDQMHKIITNKTQYIQDQGLSSIVKSALYKKDPNDTITDKLGKMSGLSDNLQDAYSKAQNLGMDELGPLQNILASRNPWKNKERAAVAAALEALIPEAARGAFGEVGVLSDPDIERYRKIIPSTSNTKEQFNSLLGVVMQRAISSHTNILESAANSKVNVSGYAPEYTKLKTLSDSFGLGKEIGEVENMSDDAFAQMMKEYITKKSQTK